MKYPLISLHLSIHGGDQCPELRRGIKAEANHRHASMLFILISCMGLLGLVMLSIDQRIKEIGIRRVLGAAVSGIVTLISKEFAMVICIAVVVAMPAGYVVLDTWLQEFAYRINLHSWMFALAGALVMALALLIVCLQAIKAALVNPAQNLRSE